MSRVRAALALTALLCAAVAARAGTFVELAQPQTRPSSRFGDSEAVSYRLYQDPGLRVVDFRLPPGARRPFCRVRADYTLALALHQEMYRSNKLVWTGQGVKVVWLDRGDYFFHLKDGISGGWYAGVDGNFDMVELSFPGLAGDVLTWEEGRKIISGSQNLTVGGIESAFARVEASTGAVRRVTLLAGSGLRVEMLRLSTATVLSDDGATSAVLFPVDGAAAVGVSTVALDLSRLYVLDKGESVRVTPRADASGADPDGEAAFYALFVTRRSTPTGVSAEPDSGRRRPVSLGWPGPEIEAGAGGKAKTPAQMVGIDWVSLPGGTFAMGSDIGDERPVHRVSVKPFALARTPVTVKQYRACVAVKVCSPPHADKCGASASASDDQPVTCVDWAQAAAFSEWVGGRLPTEAEWEYAARGGGKPRRFPWGDEEATCARAVVREGGAGACGRNAPWPVCAKPAGNTEQGLCDMAGNVYQWVQDWYAPSYADAPSDGSARRLPDPAWYAKSQRGGCWIFGSNWSRSEARSGDFPTQYGDYIGFRVAKSAE